MEIKIKRGSPIPAHGTMEAAGYDIAATETVMIKPGGVVRVHTGLRLQMPPGAHALLIGRSSMGSRELLVFPAIIDSDYRGEIMVQVINLGHNDERLIMDGDRIAQLVFMEHEDVDMIPVDELDETERGSGGFGSTGA